MLKITTRDYPGRNYGLVVTIGDSSTELVFDTYAQATDVERLLRDAYRAGKGAPAGATLWEDVPRGSVWADIDGDVGLRWLDANSDDLDCGYGDRPMHHHNAPPLGWASYVTVLAHGLTQKQCDWVAEVCLNNDEMRKRAEVLAG